MSEGSRRALCIGVGSFVPPGADDGIEPDMPQFEELEYAAKYTGELHTALAAAGYAAELVVDPAVLGARQLGECVEQHLAGGGVAVVHVLSHGDHTPGGGVYVVGSDATRCKQTRVEDWRIAVTDDPAAPMTLFLLDLCHAGAANRHWQPPEPKASERAWVIAAAGADQPAYAGRLTRAAAAVINAIVFGELDLAPTVRTVGFDVLFERIRKQVRALALAEGGHLQDPMATPVMGAQPELPFFRNPRYLTSPVAEAGEAVEAAAVPFLDPALDEEHFRDRAAGHGPAAGRVTAGCFTGRAPQLRRLAPWLDGDGPGGLIVVTGSPGVGKSALLGLLVCAAHPRLRGATQDLWRAAVARPSENPELAAVHARQRTLPVILASLTAQLQLDRQVAEGELSPTLVIDAITRQVRPPVIVVDAVDEAPDHQQIVAKLLIPLALARREDEMPACRLLIGIRPWREFAPLLALATRLGEIIDLDRIPIEQRRQDVADYVSGLLELLPGYDTATHSAGRRAFADAVAGALVPEPAAPDLAGPPSAQPRWGEFLVASLYTHTVSLRGPERMSDPVDAARLGSAVPRTLADVLELDLAARPASRWRSAILTALAHARGTGMPRSVLPAVSAAIAAEPDPPPVQQVAKELDALRFYLRTSADSDGSALYRFFHQSLADHLHDHPVGVAGRVLDGLLATVPVADRIRRWDLAEPYLLRHAVQHAADTGQVDGLLLDPEFLIHADPTTLIPALDRADGRGARLATAVYRVSAGGHPRRAAHQRRNVLAVDAARYGATALLDGLVSTPEAGRSRWHPRWATGSQVSTALRATLTGHTSPVLVVACAQLDGRAVAVTGGGDSTARVWDLTSGAPIGDPLTGHTAPVNAVACAQLGGRQIVVTGGADATVRVWDLVTGALIAGPLLGHRGTVAAVTCTQLNGRPVAVTGGADATVRVWDLTTGAPLGGPLTGHTATVRAVVCAELDNRPIAITGAEDATMRIWDLTTSVPIGEPVTGHTDTVAALACAELAGRPVVVTGGADATVRIWDLSTGTPIGAALTGHAGVVQVVACAELEARPVVVTGGADATVRIWDLATGTPIGAALTGHTGWVAAMACTQLHGRPVAVTGSWDLTVRVWDLVTGAPLGDSLPGHTHPVEAVACTQLDGCRVAVTGGWDATVRIWDLITGTPIGDPLTGHTGWVAAVACTQLEGRPIAVTAGGGDATVRIWDLITGTPVGKPLIGHTGWVAAVACTLLEGRPIAVTGGWDATVRVWDLVTGTPIGDPLTGHDATVRAIACSRLDGRPVAVTGAEDTTVRIWDLTAGTPIGDPLSGHTATVSALACTRLDGQPVAVTAGADATVRIWDLATGTPIGESVTGHTGTVAGLACVQLAGRSVAISSGRDATVRIWDLAERRQVDVFDLPTAAGAVAVSSLGEVVLGLDWDVVVLTSVPRGPL